MQIFCSTSVSAQHVFESLCQFPRILFASRNPEKFSQRDDDDGFIRKINGISLSECCHRFLRAHFIANFEGIRVECSYLVSQYRTVNPRMYIISRDG